MPNVIVSVSYDVSRNSGFLGAYGVSFADSERPVTGTLRQNGDTYNNVVHYSGVFATEADATRAVLGYVNTPCSVLAITDAMSDGTMIRLLPLSKRLPARDGVMVRLLGRRTPAGTYVSDRL